MCLCVHERVSVSVCEWWSCGVEHIVLTSTRAHSKEVEEERVGRDAGESGKICFQARDMSLGIGSWGERERERERKRLIYM